MARVALRRLVNYLRGNPTEVAVHPYPHHYQTSANAEETGLVAIKAPDLPTLESAPPAQFGGPGDRWSPETLLVAAATDCFVLTFRAIARASKLPWRRLSCSGEGTLDRVEGVTCFTALALHAELVIPADVNPDRADRLLQKAERGCLVSRSLALEPTLTSSVHHE